jgi:hypothetical protein
MKNKLVLFALLTILTAIGFRFFIPKGLILDNPGDPILSTILLVNDNPMPITVTKPSLVLTTKTFAAGYVEFFDNEKRIGRVNNSKKLPESDPRAFEFTFHISLSSDDNGLHQYRSVLYGKYADTSPFQSKSAPVEVTVKL